MSAVIIGIKYFLRWITETLSSAETSPSHHAKKLLPNLRMNFQPQVLANLSLLYCHQVLPFQLLTRLAIHPCL